MASPRQHQPRRTARPVAASLIPGPFATGMRPFRKRPPATVLPEREIMTRRLAAEGAVPVSAEGPVLDHLALAELLDGWSGTFQPEPLIADPALRRPPRRREV